MFKFNDTSAGMYKVLLFDVIAVFPFDGWEQAFNRMVREKIPTRNLRVTVRFCMA